MLYDNYDYGYNEQCFCKYVIKLDIIVLSHKYAMGYSKGFKRFFCFKYTECARDHDLYKLISCGKFVNDVLFSTIY
jgi:hypothetical protein